MKIVQVCGGDSGHERGQKKKKKKHGNRPDSRQWIGERPPFQSDLYGAAKYFKIIQV